MGSCCCCCSSSNEPANSLEEYNSNQTKPKPEYGNSGQNPEPNKPVKDPWVGKKGKIKFIRKDSNGNIIGESFLSRPYPAEKFPWLDNDDSKQQQPPSQGYQLPNQPNQPNQPYKPYESPPGGSGGSGGPIKISNLTNGDDDLVLSENKRFLVLNTEDASEAGIYTFDFEHGIEKEDESKIEQNYPYIIWGTDNVDPVDYFVLKVEKNGTAIKPEFIGSGTDGLNKIENRDFGKRRDGADESDNIGKAYKYHLDDTDEVLGEDELSNPPRYIQCAATVTEELKGYWKLGVERRGVRQVHGDGDEGDDDLVIIRYNEDED